MTDIVRETLMRTETEELPVRYLTYCYIKCKDGREYNGWLDFFTSLDTHIKCHGTTDGNGFAAIELSNINSIHFER